MMIWYKIKLLLYVIKLKKKKRTKTFVKQDYDYSWLTDKTPKEMYYSFQNKDPNEICICRFKGKFIKIKYGDMSLKRKNLIFDVVKNYINSGDEIIELGCGAGTNLFFFRDNGLMNKMNGCEQSINAITYAKKQKYDNITFFVADITKDEMDLKGKIVFTCYALEQLKHYMVDVIKNIIRQKPKLVINIETVYTHVDFISKLYIKKMDYQDNLLKILKQNNVQILQFYESELSGNPLNRQFCIVWKPTQ